MLLEGLLLAVTLKNIFIGIAGTLVGIIIGALPGLGASIAMTLALPLTFTMTPDSSIILLVALYCGATYGGSISAILLNTPGTPASGATVFDGYPMAKEGKGDIALGLSTMSSFIGGEVGAFMLITIAPAVSRFVLKFGPAESFLVAVFSLTVVGAMSSKHMLKGLISCCFGLLFSFIGTDVVTGMQRFTFGTTYLMDGVSSIIAMIGLFAVGEMFVLLSDNVGAVSQVLNAGTIHNVIKGCKMVFKYPINIIRSSLIGGVIGAMPALGVTAAAFMSYMAASSSSKNSENFGKGEPEGIVAPECANNAVTATSLIPTLTLGIPGSSTMAIILGALTIQGIVPGPDIFTLNANFVYAVLISIFFINFYMLIIGVLGDGLISRITIIPVNILAPIVLVFCVIGSYSLNMRWPDILMTLLFGVIGYVVKKFGYSNLGLVMGLILGPIAEASFHQTRMISGGNNAAFYASTMSKVLVACIIFSVVYPLGKAIYKKIKKNECQAN